MKLDITKGIQKKGVDVPFELEDAWGEDHWNGDTIAELSFARQPKKV